MKGIDRTKVIAFLVTAPEEVKALMLNPLSSAVFSATGILAPNTTLGKLRADLGWPSLRAKSAERTEDLEARVARLEAQVAKIETLWK